MNAVTIIEAKRDLESILSNVEANQEPTLIVGERGERFVVMPLAEFNAWQETSYLLSNPANADHLRASIADNEKGRVIEHELVTQ